MNLIESIFSNSFTKTPSKNNYYHATINPVDDIFYISIFTKWNDFDELGNEIRKADLVLPDKVVNDFRNLLGQKIAVIDSKEEFLSLLNFGGHSIISKAIMEKNWPEIINPKIAIHSKDYGFIDYHSITEQYLSPRYAAGNLRMQILNRDNFQCRICGSSPDNEIHARIEIHHIKPWEEGGITTPDNLITLCKLCHDNIKYVNRKILYKKIGIDFSKENHYLLDNFKNYSPNQRSQLLHYVSNTVTLKIKNNHLTRNNHLNKK